jgi:pimeloyl-ACP methyl ester carboxylesterase/DNA-binding CsgD family transcriptional regulator
MDAGQHIRFATACDGVRIAYATSGSGPPLVKAANWLSHIEFDWDSLVWRHWLRDLSARRTLIRYDERGCGLSDRDPRDLSFESWVSDLETVVEAAGVQRFPLLGVSQGAAVAIAYAARNPGRVSHLVLYGAYGRGRLVRDPSPRQVEESQTMLKLIEIGWGRESDAFRQVFTAQFIPGGSLEQLHWFNELQRMSTSPANAARFLMEFDRIDVMATAARVRCPTVVLHARGDERVPFDEGRLLAAQIPGAQFAPLDSRNHVLLAEPAWDAFMSIVSEFIGSGQTAGETPEQFGELTAREHELLELIARGLDNGAIAERLGLQVKTVRNHITHIFDKLGVRTRAEAIVKAREAGLGSRAAG